MYITRFLLYFILLIIDYKKKDFCRVKTFLFQLIYKVNVIYNPHVLEQDLRNKHLLITKSELKIKIPLLALY